MSLNAPNAKQRLPKRETHPITGGFESEVYVFQKTHAILDALFLGSDGFFNLCTDGNHRQYRPLIDWQKRTSGFSTQ